MALGKQNVKAAGIQAFFKPWVGDSTDLMTSMIHEKEGVV